MKCVVVVVFFVWCLYIQLSNCNNVTYDGKALLINGERRILFSGSIHYPRSLPDMWKGLIEKAKDGGLDVVDTYVFWNLHEPSPGTYDFQGRNDLVKFVRLVQKAGLYVHLRIGPYICGEWNFGGFPVWLKFVPGISFRTDNEPFKLAMATFTQKIVQMMKDEKLFQSQGGPIILSQIENEYETEGKEFGAAGSAYMNWAAKMAVETDTGVPWVMCKEDDAPDPMINTCNGFYCDYFSPNKPYKPTFWTEAWTAWFTTFGGPIHQRPVEDLAFAVARFIQKGGSFVNYYMFHGGTNFGRTAGGPFITTSYDYDAPIDEYGLIRQPKFGHLKQLHDAVKLCAKALLTGEPSNMTLGTYQKAKVFSSSSGDCAAFLSNYHWTSSARVTFNGRNYILPPWSISILPGCKSVIYNTAQVEVQINQMSFSPTNVEPFSWETFNEDISSIEDGPLMSYGGLLEQLNITRDTTDYLWYTTSVKVDSNESFLRGGRLPTLVAGSTGHGMHVFINGKLTGSSFGNHDSSKFKFTGRIQLQAGVNRVSLLSMAAGLPNNGPHFEMREMGVLGPVAIHGLDKGTMDLSRQTWSYKVGLEGEAMNLGSLSSIPAVDWVWDSSVKENTQPLTWYKAYFNVPEGDEPLALDMSSMQKGQVWINGKNIGRYWTVHANGNCTDCSYSGTYRPNKCQSGCGHPTQQWYHVPRSWLMPSRNLIVVFEEMGGNPSGITLVKRSITSICTEASEYRPVIKNTHQNHGGLNEQNVVKINLHCAARQFISAIKFVSFGTPSGACGNLQQGTCHFPNSRSVLQKLCVGRQRCLATVPTSIFGGDPCPNLSKKLSAEVVCQHRVTT
ncbi:beta-galactosidase 3-like [Cucurbita moschata]|uniref:Beta-galactosidase n=1 Tax=Cucurbita moschata TaxID=3662 RepID=A0A6J1G725_CUCMO|nr:beta-galactosidase 3-like [Cucurbita moschata]